MTNIYERSKEFRKAKNFGSYNRFLQPCIFHDCNIFGNNNVFSDSTEFKNRNIFASRNMFNSFILFGCENKFVHNNLFKNSIVFGNLCKFGNENTFNAFCKFGEQSSFENGNKFGDFCAFGPGCVLGDDNTLGGFCHIGESFKFGQRLTMDGVKVLDLMCLSNIDGLDDQIVIIAHTEGVKIRVRNSSWSLDGFRSEMLTQGKSFADKMVCSATELLLRNIAQKGITGGWDETDGIKPDEKKSLDKAWI